MTELSTAELEALVEEATVDAYDEYEQRTGFHVMIEDNLAVPFQTTVLGFAVTVTGIDVLPGTGIAAICVSGGHRQAIGILDLPLPDPRPAGAEWIDAYRHWEPSA
ncbi:MAG: calcium-binding protein [Actinomadura sp.]